MLSEHKETQLYW